MMRMYCSYLLVMRYSRHTSQVVASLLSSQESTSAKEKTGPIIQPSMLTTLTDVETNGQANSMETETEQKKQDQLDGKPNPRRRNISGAEKKRRPKAKALGNSQTTPNNVMNVTVPWQASIDYFLNVQPRAENQILGSEKRGIGKPLEIVEL